MKRFIGYMACLPLILAAALMVSCSNVSESENTDAAQSQWHTAKMHLNVTKTEFDTTGSTRASSTQWKDGETIYLLFTGNNGNTIEGYAVYIASEDRWNVNYYGTLNRTETAKVVAYYFDAPGTVSTSSITLNANTGVYCDMNASYVYPTGGDLNITANMIPITSRIRFKGTAAYGFNLSGVKYYSGFNRATGSLTESTSNINVSIENDGYSKYVYGSFSNTSEPVLTVSNAGYNFLAECLATMFQVGKSGWMNAPTAQSHNGWMNYVPLTGISLSVTTMSLAPGASGTLTPTFTPSNASYRDVTWTSSNTSVATVVNGKVTAIAKGTSTITATSSRDASIKATCSVTVLDTNGHAFVDLGLPSGILWATCNVGATKAEDYGDYYAWGETTTKSTYTKDNYTYTDNPTTLPLSADVARVKWGGNWRMPTSADIHELINNCTTTWTTQNGVNGRKVTSKTNSNSIFLPATGYFTSSINSTGSYGYYWSSSPLTSLTSDAYLLYFHFSKFESDGNFRYYGRSVRPVCSK